MRLTPSNLPILSCSEVGEEGIREHKSQAETLGQGATRVKGKYQSRFYSYLKTLVHLNSLALPEGQCMNLGHESSVGTGIPWTETQQ